MSSNGAIRLLLEHRHADASPDAGISNADERAYVAQQVRSQLIRGFARYPATCGGPNTERVLAQRSLERASLSPCAPAQKDVMTSRYLGFAAVHFLSRALLLCLVAALSPLSAVGCDVIPPSPRTEATVAAEPQPILQATPSPWDVSWVPEDSEAVASRIDSVLEGTGLSGYGGTILELAPGYGVNPAFALAMFRKEAEFAKQGSIAQRQNNPGNIICSGGTTPLYGATGCGGRFGIYDTMADGIKAYFWLLDSEYKPGRRYDCEDIPCIITVYCPPSDCETAHYVEQVVEWTIQYQSLLSAGGPLVLEPGSTVPSVVVTIVPATVIPESATPGLNASPPAQEEAFRFQLIDTLGTLNTLRYTSILQIVEGEATSIYQIEGDYAEPGRRRLLEHSGTGDFREIVIVGDQVCERLRNAEWECSPTLATSLREYWIKIIEGRPVWPSFVVTDHGSRVETEEEQQCRLYHQTEVKTYETGGIRSVISTNEVCFGLATCYPLRSVEENTSIHNDGRIVTQRVETHYYDFNASIEDIALPTP